MIVAITGHQNLGSPTTSRWVGDTLRSLVDRMTVTKGLTCLAKGADQLFAAILREKGIPFLAVLPSAKIESSFTSEEEKRSFRALLAAAADIVQMPFDSPSERAYFEAGKKTVQGSEALVAVWDGRPAKGLGGTGDVVQYALKEGKRVVHVDVVSRIVVELDTMQSATVPRMSDQRSR